MTTKERLKEITGKWKFPIVKENETCFVIRYQMSYIQLSVAAGEDSDGVAVTMSHLFTADNPQEMFLSLRTCNDLNCNLMQVKLYIDSDSELIIASEFFSRMPEDLEYQLDLALRSLIVAKKRFIGKYSEFESAAKLMSELDRE